MRNIISKNKSQTFSASSLGGIAAQAFSILSLNDESANINTQSCEFVKMKNTPINNRIGNYTEDELITAHQKCVQALTLMIQRANQLYQDVLDNSFEFNTAEEEEVLAKAIKYNIPYDKNDVDFFKLFDLTHDWESLLKSAMDEYQIEWDESDYRPVALQNEIDEAIEEQEEAERAYRDSVHFDYYSSRGC